MATFPYRRIALVSMPWMAVNLPSIQLATLAAALEGQGIESDVHELYLDYAAILTPDLYDLLSNGGGFTEEWLFAQHYFVDRPEVFDEYWQARPSAGMKTREIEEEILRALAVVTGDYLDRMAETVDWRSYDVVGFSLTISQTAASMALARRIKRLHPGVTIVFGGTACAGPAGAALLRICDEADIVCRTEGEDVFPEIVRRVRTGAELDDVPGICFRRGEALITNAAGPLYSGRASRPHINYDAYFRRLQRLDLAGRVGVWLPFEGSRGCWWGEKSQCTFCGLHEIMQFREWPADAVLSELEHLASRYGLTNFFAVDLILPTRYYDTFLPELKRRHKGWSLFYEMKANVNRARVELLARAGVRWVQPGIESLDRDVLRLMRKGVTPLQNVQLLKWCQEYGIKVTWNMILGTPGEDPHAYPPMAERMRRLFHLQPPTGRTEFQLHRFSPYFDRPEEFGLRDIAPESHYRYIFPIAESDLRDLVYQFDCQVDGRSRAPAEYAACVVDAASEWRRSYLDGALLEIHAGGHEVVIVDTRYGVREEIRLDDAEAALYAFLDASVAETSLATSFAGAHPQAFERLGGAPGVAARLEDWDLRGIVLREGGSIVALATTPRPEFAFTFDSRQGGAAPVRYLVEQQSGVS